jgi:hypothetical protein
VTELSRVGSQTKIEIVTHPAACSEGAKAEKTQHAAALHRQSGSAASYKGRGKLASLRAVMSGWGVARAEHLSGVCKALDSISSTEKKKKDVSSIFA